MHRSTLRVLVAAIAILLAPLSIASANLIVNGSFEDPDIAMGTFSIYGSITGWTSTVGGGIEIQDNVAGSPYDGAQHVELDSTSNSNMIQTVATVAGASYDFSFAYSPRRGVGALDNGIDVYFDSVLVVSLATNGVGLSDSSWTVYSFTVMASGASSDVEFIATGTSNSLGGYIDAVSLDRATPEPSTFLLLLLGAAAVMRKRR